MNQTASLLQHRLRCKDADWDEGPGSTTLCNDGPNAVETRKPDADGDHLLHLSLITLQHLTPTESCEFRIQYKSMLFIFFR